MADSRHPPVMYVLIHVVAALLAPKLIAAAMVADPGYAVVARQSLQQESQRSLLATAARIVLAPEHHDVGKSVGQHAGQHVAKQAEPHTEQHSDEKFNGEALVPASAFAESGPYYMFNAVRSSLGFSSGDKDKSKHPHSHHRYLILLLVLIPLAIVVGAWSVTIIRRQNDSRVPLRLDNVGVTGKKGILAGHQSIVRPKPQAAHDPLKKDTGCAPKRVTFSTEPPSTRSIPGTISDEGDPYEDEFEKGVPERISTLRENAANSITAFGPPGRQPRYLPSEVA